MKVAILSCSADPTNGYGNITINYCNQLHLKSIDFVLFLPFNHDVVINSWSSRIKYNLPKALYSFDSARIVYDLFHDLSKFKGFSIIHSLFTNTSLIIAARAARKFNIKFIAGEQGTYAAIPFLGKVSSYLYKFFIKNASIIIFPSNFTRKIFCNFYGGKSIWNKTCVILNGVDFHRFNKLHNIEKQKYKFVGVGALKERKGFEYAIKAIGLAKQKIPNISYTIIGAGPEKYRRKLENIIADLGLIGNVFLVGPKSGYDLVKEMSDSFCYLHTPLSFDWNFEGYGIVYTEANALGLPVIGTDSGGVTSAIKDGLNGYIANEADPEDISKKIIQMCTDDVSYIQMKIQSIEIARARDWEKIVDQFLFNYRKLTG
jgi:glycosyltransferase involved in cell wall biosynthesis